MRRVVLRGSGTGGRSAGGDTSLRGLQDYSIKQIRIKRRDLRLFDFSEQRKILILKTTTRFIYLFSNEYTRSIGYPTLVFVILNRDIKCFKRSTIQ